MYRIKASDKWYKEAAEEEADFDIVIKPKMKKHKWSNDCLLEPYWECIYCHQQEIGEGNKPPRQDTICCLGVTCSCGEYDYCEIHGGKP